MDERQTSRRGGRKQPNVAFIAVAAVVLLVIGGLIGSAIQSGKVKSAKAQLNEATAQLTQLGDKYEEQIATMQQLLEEKQAQIDQLQTGVPATEPNAETEGENPSAPAPDNSADEGNGLGFLGTFIIIFIIIVLVIVAIVIAYNAFRRKGGDDDDDDDYDDDYDDDEDYDDDDYEDEEE